MIGFTLIVSASHPEKLRCSGSIRYESFIVHASSIHQVACRVWQCDGCTEAEEKARQEKEEEERRAKVQRLVCTPVDAQ